MKPDTIEAKILALDNVASYAQNEIDLGRDESEIGCNVIAYNKACAALRIQLEKQANKLRAKLAKVNSK